MNIELVQDRVFKQSINISWTVDSTFTLNGSSKDASTVGWPRDSKWFAHISKTSGSEFVYSPLTRKQVVLHLALLLLSIFQNNFSLTPDASHKLFILLFSLQSINCLRPDLYSFLFNFKSVKTWLCLSNRVAFH